MKWKNSARELYQESEQGKAHAYYYIYRIAPSDWRAGRYWLGRDVDFRLTFSSAKVARDYIARYDEDKARLIITAVTA